MYEFQNPHALWNSIDKQLPDIIFDQKANEACMISIFAIGFQLLTNANDCDVRLVKDKEPIEAEVKTEKELLGFQIVISPREGKKLKEELLSNKETYSPVSFEKFVELINNTIEKKARKYGSGRGVNLLIYALIGNENVSSIKITKHFSKLKAVFDSIWVLSPVATVNRQGVFNGQLVIKLYPNVTFDDHVVFANDGIGHNRPPSRWGAMP